MAIRKTHDITIKIGEYEVNGDKKGRYLNIGSMMEGDNGPFLLLNAYNLPMELNYLANPKRSDKIIASLFEVKSDDNKPKAKATDKRGNIGKGDSTQRGDDFGDEIPF